LKSPQLSVPLVGKTICGSICASSIPVPRPQSTSIPGVEQVPMSKVVAASATVCSPPGLLGWNT
jgi:hypothetical protein